MRADGWLALHVHHQGDLTSLVLESLAPAADGLQRAGKIRLWHHVRYWNGGPHVRLRALPMEVSERDFVQGQLRVAAETYLDQNPSSPGDHAAYAKVVAAMDQLHRHLTDDHPYAEDFLEPVEPLVSADAVLEQSYDFDFARYGNGELREIAERHFAASTQISVLLLRACAGRSSLLRAWSARLMAALPPALDLDARGSECLLERYRDATRYFAAVNGEASMSYQPFEAVADDVRAAIEDAAGRGSAEGGSAVLLARWRAVLADSARRIEAATRSQEAPQTPADLLIDYVHMTNNRLGLPVAEEAHLADILYRGFEEIVK